MCIMQCDTPRKKDHVPNQLARFMHPGETERPCSNYQPTLEDTIDILKAVAAA